MAIIAAAGSGVRMKTDTVKQFLELNGKPLLCVTLMGFQASPSIDGIIIVAPERDVSYCRKNVVEKFNFNKVRKVIAGGKRRQDSVRLGIEASAGDYEFVLIHDGVRPLIQERLIDRVVVEGKRNRAVITGLQAKETIKEIDRHGSVIKTHNRRKMWLIQTPQIFRYNDIMTAHKRAVDEGWENVTDDALLMEKMGIPVKVIEGSEENIKVTTLYDLGLVRSLLKN